MFKCPFYRIPNSIKASFALDSFLVPRLFSPGAASLDCYVFQLSFRTGRHLAAASFGRVVSAPLLLEEKGARAKKAHEQLKRHYIHEALPHWAPFCCCVVSWLQKCLNSPVCIRLAMSFKTVVVRFIMTSFRCVSVVSFYLLALHYNTAAIITLQLQNFETKRFSIFWSSLYN